MSATHSTLAQDADELQIALVALSSEVLHEITSTLLLLRMLSSDGPDALLAGEARQLAEPELARVDRLMSLLRTFKLPPPALSPVPLKSALQLAAAGLVLRSEFPTQLTVSAQPAELVMALKHLLRFVSAQAQKNEVELKTVASATAGLSLEIFCQAQMARSAAPTSLLNLWHQAPQETGLLIAHYILRRWGWLAYFEHSDKHVGFRVDIPSLRNQAP